MESDEYEMVIELTNATIDMLDLFFINHTYPEKFYSGDLEFIVEILKGFLSNYEAITIDKIRKALKYMTQCIDAHEEVVYSFEKNFYDNFMLVMDRIIGKLYFEKAKWSRNPKFTYDNVEEMQRNLTDIMDMH